VHGIEGKALCKVGNTVWFIKYESIIFPYAQTHTHTHTHVNLKYILGLYINPKPNLGYNILLVMCIHTHTHTNIDMYMGCPESFRTFKIARHCADLAGRGKCYSLVLSLTNRVALSCLVIVLCFL